MRNFARFQVKIDLSKAISTIKDFSCLVGNSSKRSMKNDMFDFYVLKLFDINTRSGKVLQPLPVRWEFPSPSWVKINIDGAARGSPSLVACGGIFRGSMEEFIGGFSTFLDIQNALVAEFYGVIHVIEEVKKMGFSSL
ncbi:uncharacterized protein [Phaseolus vulgaris]|uniref:uncharacterized protein n=1 Tax=Phaseolus vulgaris TaxID=3885 RepID=UPI0035CC891B